MNPITNLTFLLLRTSGPCAMGAAITVVTTERMACLLVNFFCFWSPVLSSIWKYCFIFKNWIGIFSYSFQNVPLIFLNRMVWGLAKEWTESVDWQTMTSDGLEVSVWCVWCIVSNYISCVCHKIMLCIYFRNAFSHIYTVYCCGCYTNDWL